MFILLTLTHLLFQRRQFSLNGVKMLLRKLLRKLLHYLPKITLHWRLLQPTTTTVLPLMSIISKCEFSPKFSPYYLEKVAACYDLNFSCRNYF